MDRRKQNRKSTNLIMNAYQDGYPAIVKCDNISVRGMRFRRVLGPKFKHRCIDIEFQLPDDKSVLCVRGKPIYERREGHVVGVRFVGITSAQRSRVRAFVEGTERANPRVACAN